ncbi:MAG: K(+)-transporting ATPase subunit F [Peptococcaceae bacterium]|jgi:K+-transporting ATPase KdpF subunit|nr:K(+)-transporting ATPase subunit F [Peptococcaceae bacterium]
MFSPVWLPLKGGGKDMDMIIGAVVTLGLLIYLTYSLIKAEDL